MSTIERNTASSLQTNSNRHFAMARDNALPESYHLDGGGNFGVWAYKMKNLLKRTDASTTASHRQARSWAKKRRWHDNRSWAPSTTTRRRALSSFRRYHDPYECWTGLKTRYESDSGPWRVMLIEKFLWKTESISMDAHLTEVREVANLLEEVEVDIPEDIIMYYTLRNLPKEYEIFKWM